MKKNILVFISFSFLFSWASAQEKAFQKGKVTISIGAGLGLYQKQTHSELSIGNATFKSDSTDGTTSGIFPLMIEYGLRNWLGLGVRGAYAKLIASSGKPTVTSTDLGLLCNIHLIKTVRFDLPLSLTFGYSGYKSMSNDGYNTLLKSGGINYGISFLPRLYFGSGRRFGVYLDLGYAGYNYPKVHLTSTSYSTQTIYDITGKLKTQGANLGLGLILKM